ncbi:PLP-dependent aminotransferase family protein [Rhodobacteraceae bacterium CH30]|nr:PLP-dependent aminotransferase family protein [Rhodobacteraceae bacterium CH30]
MLRILKAAKTKPMGKATNATLAEQIVMRLCDSIDQGILPPGSRLPSVRQYAQEHQISTFTVSEAYQRLVSRGYTVSRKGSGYFVAAQGRQPVHPSPALNTLPVDDDWLLSRIYQRDSKLLMAGCGWLPEHWYDREANARAMRAIARRNEPFHPYGDPKGYAPLRAEIARQLAREHLDVSPEHIILTQGASKALDMVACTLARPGDTLFIDEPGYCNLISCLRFRGFNLVGVPWTAQGPDLAQLEALLARHKPKLFFTNPLLHNPTGANYTLATAHAVMKLMDAHDCIVVEDNVAQPFHPKPQPPLCSLAAPGKSLYIGSFSKSLAPGLRVGYVASHSGHSELLLRYKMISGLTTPVLNEMLVMELNGAPGSRRQLDDARDALSQAQYLCQQRFHAAGWSLFAQPEHGLFLLAKPPTTCDAANLTERARKQGIMLAPGKLFSSSDGYQDWWRFNVAYSRNSLLWDFLDGK